MHSAFSIILKLPGNLSKGRAAKLGATRNSVFVIFNGGFGKLRIDVLFIIFICSLDNKPTRLT